MGAHKPTALLLLLLYIDLKKAAPLTRMSILKNNFQNAIYHTNTNTNTFAQPLPNLGITYVLVNLKTKQNIILMIIRNTRIPVSGG